MRKVLQILFATWFLTVPAAAQRGRGGMGGGFHGGGFVGPGFHGGFANRGFQGFRGGYYHGPYFRGPYYRGGYYYGNRFFFGPGFPYWPYYSAGWPYPPYAYPYYPYYAYSYSSPSWYPYDYGYAYTNSDRAFCPQANGTSLYLIKLTYEDTVRVAQSYWYTAGTLNFTTLQGEQNKTPIDTIDRALTFQLNSACGLNFQFP